MKKIKTYQEFFPHFQGWTYLPSSQHWWIQTFG